MKDTEREKVEKTERAAARPAEAHGQAPWGRILLVARTSRWCYATTGLSLLVVLVAIGPLMAYVEPFLQDAASQLKGIRPETIKLGVGGFVFFVRAVALVSALANAAQGLALRLEVYEGGLRCLRGWFNREALSVAADRVRGTSLQQAPWQKRLGYGTLQIDYGSIHGPLCLEGIDRPEEVEKKVSSAFHAAFLLK